jgi:Uma2 family endonuclease
MDVISQNRRLTAEDLPYAVPEEGLCELVRGDLVREPPPGEEHGWVGAKLMIALGGFVQERGLGRVYLAETGFVLARDPDTVRAPDIAFVSQERPGPPGSADLPGGRCGRLIAP